MAEARVSMGMSAPEIIIKMGGGNPGAMTCLAQMLNRRTEGFLDVLALDKMRIYGAEIYYLWNDCCGRNMEKLHETIRYLNTGNVPLADIHKNLTSDNPKPFI